MKIKLMFFFLLCQCLSYSQEEFNHSGYWPQENEETIVGVKNCYIRSEPSTSGLLLDSLQMGSKVKILRTTENLQKIKGINTNWAEIQYRTSRGDLKLGYIWKGFLALGFVSVGEERYLTTIAKITQKTNKDNYTENIFHIATTVLNPENEVLAEKVITKNVIESRYFQSKAIGGLGMDNLSNIYRISFNGEACGVPSYYFYFGWNGKELIELPEKMEVGDAGVFYHSETFLFPKEPGGKPNFIFKDIEDAEAVDDTSELYDISKSKETYTWDGKKATLIKTQKFKKFRKTLD
ncbi:SH3 domain-containing protein [Flavobacterium amniphilum]|uniref:SH3 domain-containing protein n=1 Tax=Flavobacterium amniphilum TaxID=1834035 RepID=UPI00202ABD19|nr:SH3 domain-containing protein [Flavobacterium amniphilum]MCL9804155.1 SH3 domain-containing protein [Flavobacterium amniphilum]